MKIKIIIALSLLFLLSSCDYLESEQYHTKIDRYHINNTIENTDSILKTIQFNIHIPNKFVKEKFVVKITNNKTVVTYNFFKTKNGYSYFILNKFNHKKYIENSWSYVDNNDRFFVVQYYPYFYNKNPNNDFLLSIYSGSFKQNNNITVNLEKEFNGLSIDKLKATNGFDLRLKNGVVYIVPNKPSFRGNTDNLHVVLEFKLKTETKKHHVIINPRKMLTSNIYTYNIGYKSNELDYLSLFIYDKDIMYENKLVIIGK